MLLAQIDWFVVDVVIVVLLLFGASLLTMLMSQRIFISQPELEVVIVANRFYSSRRYGKIGGIIYIWPWEIVLAVILVDPENSSLTIRPAREGETEATLTDKKAVGGSAEILKIRDILTKDGVPVSVSLEYVTATGIGRDPINGQVLDNLRINMRQILRAFSFSEADQAKRDEYIADRVAAHVAQWIGLVPFEAFFFQQGGDDQATVKEVWLPTQEGQHIGQTWVEPVECKTRNEILQTLQYLLWLAINNELEKVGFSVHNFALLPISVVGSELRDAIRNLPVVKKNLAAAKLVEAAYGKDANGQDQLSPRLQLLVASVGTNPEAFARASGAEAMAFAITNVTNAITEATKVISEVDKETIIEVVKAIRGDDS